MTLAAVRPEPRIRSYLPNCVVCDQPAIALVRWRYQPSPHGDFQGHCRTCIPWDDPTAEMYPPMIRIRQ